MRILIRVSPLAIWARRIAALALPLTVLAIAMHYQGSLVGAAFDSVAVLALAVAALALVLSVAALIVLWLSGDRGWGRAVGALFVSLFCLAPAGAAGYAMWRYPDLTEISTDTADPPVLITAAPAPTAATEALATEAFPGVRTRRYGLDGPSVFAIVESLVKDRGWTVIALTEPVTALDTGALNAIAIALGGWRDEVAIRVVGNGLGADVDMRSAALSAGHDLGANGRRIESFLADLDAAVARRLRTGPAELPDADAPDIITAPFPAPPPGANLQD